MSWAWRHTEWQQINSHTQRKNTGGVCGQVLSAEGRFITLAVLLGCRQSHRGTRCKWYTHWVMCYCHQRKIPKECPTASSGGFEYGTTVLWYNADINRSRKGSASGSMPYETRSLRKNFVSRTQNFFQSVRLLSA